MAYRLSDLARLVDGTIQGDSRRPIEGVRPLERAGANDLSFVSNPRYRALARESSAGALLVNEPISGCECDFLIVADPYLALALILSHLHRRPDSVAEIDPTARVESTAEIAESVSIGAYAVVGDGTTIGPGVRLGAHVVVGRHCRIGADTVVYPGAVVYDGTVIGERCILHAGAVIGSDGFGYAQAQEGHVKLEHLGRVVLEDDVEIGANSTIDRALLDETRIGAGTKIDNLVQVAHNVQLGQRCLLISQSGIAGSSRLGNGVVLAGQAGISGHLELGEGVQVAAKSAVFKSVEAGRKVAGIPAIDAASWRRQQALTARLHEIRKRLLEMERRLDHLEESEGDDA